MLSETLSELASRQETVVKLGYLIAMGFIFFNCTKQIGFSVLKTMVQKRLDVVFH